ARGIVKKQITECSNNNPQNLEEQALSLVGKDIYEILIKGYTEKQWGQKATELPPFIIKRIPVRFTYDNNYFNDKYQGIPEGGYNNLIYNLIKGADIKCNVDYFSNKEYFDTLANKIIFTGKIDEFYNYRFGKLEYRSLRFEEEVLNTEDYQGNAVFNFTDFETPYTRIIEHKHFEKANTQKTVITYEYPCEWTEGSEAYYPINDDKNSELFNKYNNLAQNEQHVLFGGRLAEYKYYDMHQIIEKVLGIDL
ncbi:MAG: UDP-galactopyranose mutase, partial [Bacteroidales bacterium]